MAVATPNNQDLLINRIAFGLVSSTRVFRIPSVRFEASKHHHRSTICLIENTSLETESDPAVKVGPPNQTANFFYRRG